MRFLLLLMFVSALSIATPAKKETKELAKELDRKPVKEMEFGTEVIEGQAMLPGHSVVNGDVPQSDSGVLRLRREFKDRVAEEAGEFTK